MAELTTVMIMIVIFHDKLPFLLFAYEEEHLHDNFPLFFIYLYAFCTLKNK